MVTKRTYKQIAAAVLVLIITLPLLALIIPTETRDLSDLSAPTPATKSSLWFSLFSSTSNSRISQPGTPIMGAMKNETIKAELGRSAWRLLHTMAGKFPAKPTQAQMTAMNDFIYLFGQLYPCGDCAKHFQVILQEHPPVVTSKIAVAEWACMVHNIVNKRKEKPIFDCSRILEFYDCGCGPEEDGNGN